MAGNVVQVQEQAEDDLYSWELWNAATKTVYNRSTIKS